MRSLLVAFTALLAGCATVQPEPPQTPAAQAVAVQPPVGELSDKDLQEQWWTWAASTPEERNPVVDATGEFCAEEQPSDVWFFAGTFGGHADRTCEVPAGRPLAGPAVNFTGTQLDCSSSMGGAKGSVTLDGKPVELRRIAATPITYRAAQDNAMGVPGGLLPTRACGLWAWIPPLSAGEHELLVTGESGSFSVSARYRLTVVAKD